MECCDLHIAELIIDLNEFGLPTAGFTTAVQHWWWAFADDKIVENLIMYHQIRQKYTLYTSSTHVLAYNIYLRDPSTCSFYQFFIRCDHSSIGRLDMADINLSFLLNFAICNGWQINLKKK